MLCLSDDTFSPPLSPSILTMHVVHLRTGGLQRVKDRVGGKEIVAGGVDDSLKTFKWKGSLEIGW